MNLRTLKLAAGAVALRRRPDRLRHGTHCGPRLRDPRDAHGGAQHVRREVRRAAALVCQRAVAGL